MMKKRIMSWVLALALVLSLLPVSAAAEDLGLSAATEIASGTCGSSVTWVLTDDGVLTISGTGAMEDFCAWADVYYMPSFHNYPYGDMITSVVVEEGITSIGSFAFYGLGYVTSVSIPSTVTSIGEYAFYNCSGLTSVTIPGNGVSLGAYAFSNCGGLKKIEFLGSPAATYPGNVFDSVTATAYYPAEYPAWVQAALGGTLTWRVAGTEDDSGSTEPEESVTWTLENGVLTISGTGPMEDYMWWELGITTPWYDSSVTQVIIEDGITRIGDYAFYETSLTEVTIPASVTSIGESAFAYSFLKTITFEGDAPTIGTGAFGYIEATVNYPAGNATWTSDVMQNYGGTLTWEESAPSGTCGENLTWTLEDGVLTISGAGPMNDCSSGSPWREYINSINSVVIEDGVTSISEYAFYSYYKLNDVTIGSGVTSVADWAFSYSEELSAVTFTGDAPAIGEGAFSGITATVYYPADDSSWDSVANQNYGGTLTWEAVEMGGSEEPDNSCGENLTWTFANNTLTISGTGAMTNYTADNPAPWKEYFLGTDNISVVIESGVTTIGDYAFDGCTRFAGTTLPNTVVSIGNYAFQGCKWAGSFTIPDSVKTIGNYAFANYNMSSLLIGNGVETIGEGAFFCCYPIESVVIPDSVKTIGDEAFRGCSKLSKITIGSGVTSIGDDAFMGCSVLSIYFTGNAPTLGGDIFKYLSVSCYYPAGDATWTSDVMQNYGGTVTWIPQGTCGDNLTWTLKNGVLTISGTGEMTSSPWNNYGYVYSSVVVGEGVASISASAFNGRYGDTTALTSVTLPSTLTSIGSSAFYSNTNLTQIELPDNLKKVSDWAFAYTGLTSISIPATVETVDYYAFVECTSLSSVEFLGNAPTIGEDAFYKVTATVSYPAGNVTWTSDVMQNYGGTLTWVAVGGSEEADEEAPVVSELTEDEEDNICTGSFTKIYVTATDNVGVTKIVLTYALEGEEPVVFATLTGSDEWPWVATWDVDELPDGVYTITAVAYDAAGNASKAATINVIVDNVKPVLNALNVVNSEGGTQFGGKYDKVTVKADASGTGVGDYVLLDYSPIVEDIEENEQLRFSVDGSGELDVSAWDSGEYTFYAVVCDTAGNSSASCSITITVDNKAPAAPTGLTVTASALKNTLSWSRSTETDARSAVYRAESETGERTLLKMVDSDAINQSYEDTAVEVGKTYYYWVAAQDALGNESAATGPVSVTTLADTTLPWVSAISPVNKSKVAGSVIVNITAEDDIRVKSVKLECSSDGKNWTEIGTVEAANAQFSVDTTKYADGTLYLRITVVDTADNEYINSETYSYTVDNTPPEQVTGLTGTAASTIVTLNWEDVAAQDFGHFVVEQKQSDDTYKQVKTVSDALGVYVTGLAPDTAYTFRVYAVDQLGNEGEPSAEYTVTTATDTAAPVITNIRPNPGRYNGDAAIPLTFTVADDYGVSSLLVQISYDGTEWTEAATVSVNEVGTSVQVSYNLSTAGLAEGVLYVRAVATDLYKNESDSAESAPYIQYVIDRTAPAAPSGLTAEAGQGYVSLAWEQGSEDDLSTYTVYRSTAADGEFTAISSGLKQLYLVDTNVVVGTTYYYCIDVTDQVGHRSAFSETISAVPQQDETAPQIVSVSPSAGYAMGSSTAIQVKVGDNQQVATLYYQVSDDGGETWTEAATITVNAAEQVVSLPLVQKNLSSGAFQVKVWCVDAAKNESESVTRSYTLDLTAPAAPDITVTADNMAIQLSWSGGSETDLSGYRVYRAENGSSDYQLLFQRSGGQSSYSYTDSSVSVDSAYSYYIEAVDTRGNTAAGGKSEFVVPIDRDVAAPTAVLDGPVSGATGYEISFSAIRSTDNVGAVGYLWDFGDGTTANTATVNHAFEKAGTYTVTLTVYDEAGNKASDSMTVTVRDPESVGDLTIQVKDESGQVVPYAGIYMDLGSDGQSVLYTNSMGVINLHPTSGVHVIGVYTDGYLPAKTTVTVVAGRSETVTINVVKKDIVVGELTVERMTLEQIKAAGIDVTDPANQFVYEFNIKLTYGTYEEYISAQYNGEGKALKDPEPIEVIDSNGDTRYLTINVIPIRPGGGGGGGDGTDSGTGGGSYGPGGEEQEVPMVVIMDIPGKASWLKDFFDVRLTVINQADSQFVLDDCQAYLNVPAGLTLMDTVYTKADPSYDMGSIVGQTSQTAQWVLRGDKGGEYDLTADFSAVLREFGTKISAQFQTEEPFRVRQGDGLTLDIVVENAILADTDGSIKVGLRNDDEFPYYLPDLTLDPDVVDLVDSYKTNGRVKVDTERDTLYTGETIWWEYIVPRENWETLTTYSGEDFYLMEAVVEATGGNAVLPYTIQEVMPFSINGDRIVVTRVSSGGGESEVSFLNLNKASAFSAVIPSLMIRTYSKNEAGEYVPAPLEITIKDDYKIGKEEMSENGITVTTNENGEYTYEGYSFVMADNDKSFNIRVSASRAKPVDIPVVIRGETAETGRLTVYAYIDSGNASEGSDSGIKILEGATVTILNVDGAGKNLTDPTDKDGKAEFKNVPQGKQTVQIEMDGYLPVTAVVDVGEDTEVSYRLYTDDNPSASRIIQIENDLTGWGSGNQTIFPEGRVTGTIKFQLTRRIAQGEEFKCYHYRITDKDGALVKTETFKADDGFWLELKDLKAGYTLEFAVETDKGVSEYMDANLIVTTDPGFFGDLVYNLTQIQMGGKVDFTSGLEFDPSTFIKEFTVADIVEGVQVKDDEKGYQAEAIEHTNVYSFTKEESKQIYPISAKYDLSGKLTLSVILGGEKETSTTTGGSYSAAAYVETPDYVAYQGVVAVAKEEESDKKKVSGQLQVDFVYQYDPARNDWSLAVYGKIGAEQNFTLLEATFLKMGYVSADLKFEESATLELARTGVGPEEKIEVLGDGLIPKEMKAGGELKTSVGAKLASKKIASVGAYMKVGLDFQLLPDLKLTASAALGAEGNVLIWSKEKDLVSNKWELSGEAAPAALAAFALYDLRSNTEDTLSLASAPAQTWRMVENSWITGAYEQAEPQLVTLNDGTILAVWCGYTGPDETDTETVVDADPVALYWSVYENGVWSDPARVDADGTADLYPSLIVTDKGVQLVWVDFTDSVVGMDNLTYTEIEKQAFTMLGVTIASFNGSGWTVTEAYAGGMLAANPKAAVGADGSVLVSWIANAGNSEVATAEKPDSISWVLLNAQGTILSSGSMKAPAVTIADLGVGYDEENGYQLAALADNGEGMLKLYHAELQGQDGEWSWSELSAASSIASADAAMATAADGTVYTINSGRIYAYADGAYRHVLRSDLLGEDAGELTCVENAQGTVLFWTTTLGTDSAVCMMQVDENGTVSQPVVVDSTEDGVFSVPTAAATGTELTIMYQHASAVDGKWNHDVLMKSFAMGVDLSLENSLIQHSGYLVPGAYLESYIEVENLGVTAPDSFAVEVYYVDADGNDEVIGVEEGSGSMNLTLKWTVPATYAGEPMYFRVVSDADGNSDNDAVQLGNLIRELEVSNLVYVGLLDGKDVFTLDVANQGLATSEETTLTVSVIGGEGSPLLTTTVEALAPGAKRTIRVELTGLNRTADLPLAFVVTPLTGEGDLANNNEYLILSARKAKASVTVNGVTTLFSTLEEAVKGAQASAVIYLLADVTMAPAPAELVLDKELTIELNGNALWAADADLSDYAVDPYTAVQIDEDTWVVKKSGYVAWNMQTGQYYESLSDALAAADGEEKETIVVLQDCVEEYLVIAPGTTLDLSDCAVVANYVVVLKDGYLTGNTESAKMIVHADCFSLPEKSYIDSEGYNVMPIWNPNGYYVFSRFEVSTIGTNRGLRITEDEIYFQFVVNTSGFARRELLFDGASDNEISIVVRLEWETENGTAHQDFVYNDKQISSVSAGGRDYGFSLKGYNALEINLDTLSVKGMAITKGGAITVGTKWSE